VRGIPAIHHPPMAVHQYNRNGIVPAQLLNAVQHSKDAEEEENTVHYIKSTLDYIHQDGHHVLLTHIIHTCIHTIPQK